jgi:hypothetical protein
MCAWDAHQRSRVYRLQKLPSYVFDKVVEATVRLGEPIWPLWVPTWSLPDSEALARIEHEVDQLLTGAGDEGFLLLTSRLEEWIEAALAVSGPDQLRAFPDCKMEDAAFEEWRRLFHLSDDELPA